MTINPEEERLKALITEARQTLKDLKTEKKSIEEYIRTTAYRVIDEEIGVQISQQLTSISQEVKQSEAAIKARFRNIEEIMLGSSKNQYKVEDVLRAKKLLADILAKEKEALTNINGLSSIFKPSS